VEVTGSTRKAPELTVVAAIYDAHGRFIAMDFQAVTDMAPGTGEVTLTVDNSKGEAAEIRTFLVKDLTDLTPMGPSQSYPAK